MQRQMVLKMHEDDHFGDFLGITLAVVNGFAWGLLLNVSYCTSFQNCTIGSRSVEK